MPNRSARRYTVGVLATAILTACGGGGGNVPTPPTSASYDFQLAMARLVRTGATASVSLSGTTIVQGVSTAFTGTGTFTLSPAVNGTFNGMAAMLQKQSITGTVMVAGQSAPFSVSVVHAYDEQGEILGESQANEFDVAPTPIFIPAYLTMTQTPLGTLSRYTDSQLSSVEGVAQLSVVVQFIPIDPGSPEVVQVAAKVYDVRQALVESDDFSYYLTSDGSLSFFSATTQSDSGTLIATLQ